MTSTTRSNTTTARGRGDHRALFAAAGIRADRTSTAKTPRKGCRQGPRIFEAGRPLRDQPEAPAEQRYDSFIVSFQKGAKAVSDQQLQRNLDNVGKLVGARIAIQRTQATVRSWYGWTARS